MLFFQRFLFGSHLGEDEQVIFVVHKHWVEIAKMSMKIFILAIILPWTLWYFLGNIFFWVAVAWTVVGQAIYLHAVLDWYADAWLFTNMSIIDVEWKGFFHKLSSRVDYNDIKEVSWEKSGISGTILNYGNMSMSLTSGDHVLLENCKSPKQTELTIHKIREEYVYQRKMMDSGALQEILVDLVHKHISERGIPPREN